MLTLQRVTLAIVMDHLHGVARRLGKDASEEVIWFAALRIAEVVGDRGSVHQVSPGQFKVALYVVGDDWAAHRLTAEIHASLRQPFTVRGQEIFSSASVGIATGTSVSADSLERHAFEAVRRVQANGGDATFQLRCTPPYGSLASAAA
jgi:GGDEF domain-containing protein